MNDIYNKSFLAGVLIGMGVLINTYSKNSYIGAVLFSLGLLAIIATGAYLYTGKIGYALSGKFSVGQYILMLFANCLGISVAVGIGAIADSSIIGKIYEVSDVKFAKTPIELLASSILCGMCVYIAVAGKSQLITLMAVTIFILCGFEHCIADFPYLVLHDSSDLFAIVKWVIIVVGNSLGAIIMNVLHEPMQERIKK